MKKHLLYSAFSHIALMSLPLLIFMSGGKPAHSPSLKDRYDAEKVDIIPIELVELQRPTVIHSTEGNKVKKKYKNHKCNTHYVGIGITIISYTGLITEVVEGYPAHFAGLQQGDQVLDYDPDMISGAVGNKITLNIKKNDGIISQVVLSLDKICTDERGK